MLPGPVFGFFVQQGNGQVLCTWNLVPGVTGYSVQRSTDGVNYATISTPTLNQFLDSAVTAGSQYFYQVASTNVTGTGPYTNPQGVVPVIAGQASLGSIRLSSQQRADLVNSNQITLPEW